MKFSLRLLDWFQRSHHSARIASPCPRARVLQLAELEDRILFSAGPAPGPDPTVEGPPPDADPADTGLLQPSLDQATMLVDAPANNEHSADTTTDEGSHALDFLLGDDPKSSLAGEQISHELVFVDAHVADSQVLLDALGQLDDPSRHVEVIWLDAEQDGIEQIAATLASREGVDAIHIVSHGRSGELRLGQATLNLETMTGRYADALQAIGSRLTSEADILIYGCDFAAGATGQAAVQAFADLTGADVAASTDATGQSQLGGNWILESQLGSIHTAIIVGSAAQAEWNHLLATLDWDTVDWTSGSLSQSYNVGGGTVAITITGDTSRFQAGSPDDNTNNTVGLSPVEESLYLSMNYEAQAVIGDEAITLTIDFSHTGGVSDVSFTIFDVDKNTWTDQVVVTAYNGAIINPSSVTVGSTLVFDGVNTVTGTASNPSSSPNGNATFTFHQTGITQVSIVYQSGQLSDPSQQQISLHDLTFTPANAAPVNSVPGGQSTNEDTTLVFSSANGNQISISDSDAGSNPVQVTLSASNGVFSLNGTTGLTFLVGDGTSDATMTLTGTITDINTALNGLRFSPVTDFNGAASLTITTDDLGHTGSGGAMTDSDTVVISVNAVNDAPVNNVPGLQMTDMNTARIFSTANGNLISISDVDAGSSPLQVTLTATNGTLTLSGTTGLTFSSGDGTADSTMTFTGTAANLNAALDGLRFQPTTGFSGAAALQIVTNDLGNSGSGGAQSDSDSVTIQVGAVVFQQGVNGYFGTEDTEIRDDQPNTALGNNTSITVDLDDGGVTQGLIQFESIFGAGAGQIPFGSTIQSATLTVYVINTSDSGVQVLLSRMLVDWNEASTWNSLTNGVSLNGTEASATPDVTFTDVTTTGFKDFTGLASTVQAWSNGEANHGWVFTINSTDGWDFRTSEHSTVAQRPYLTISYTPPQPALIDLDADDSSGAAGNNFVATFTEDGGAVAVADSDATITDADSGSLTSMTVTITNLLDGTAESLSANTSGTSITATYNSGTGVLSLTGMDTVAHYQQVLRTITYNNTSDTPNTTSRSITFVATDTYATSNTATSTIAITAINDGPVNSVPVAQTINEDTALVFSSANDNQLSISDADAGTNPIQVTLTASTGTVTLSGTTGLTFVAGSNGSATMTITGTISNLNNALNGLSFTPTADFNGLASLQVTTNDLGNSGSGGARSDSDAIAITVNPVNDAPINSVPGNQATNEDTPLVFSSGTGNPITISDVDAGASSLQITLTSTNGALSLSGTAGLTFTLGDGALDPTMTFTGSLADINNALNGLSFLPTTNYYGTATVTLTTNDQGHSGSGGAKSDSDSISITVNELNDAPVASDASLATDEDHTLSGNVLSFVTDPDNTDGINGNEDTLTAVLDAGPAHGMLTLNPDGSFSYTPNGNFFGTDSFTFHAVDSDGAVSEVRTVTFNITSINDVPVALGESFSMNQSTILSGSGLLLNDSDIEGDLLQTVLFSGPSHGTLTLAPDGSFVYSPESSYYGSDSFRYRVWDGEDFSNVVEVTIEISAVQPIGGNTPPPDPGGSPTPAPDPSVFLPDPVKFPELNSPTRIVEDSTPLTTPAKRDKGGPDGILNTLSGPTLTFSDWNWSRIGFQFTDRNPLTEDLPLDAWDLSEVSGQAAQRLAFEVGWFWRPPDHEHQDNHTPLDMRNLAVGATISVVSAFSVGYVAWTLRGGYLLSSLLASLPAWRAIDPLPVLQSFAATEASAARDTSLASLVAQRDPPPEFRLRRRSLASRLREKFRGKQS